MNVGEDIRARTLVVQNNESKSMFERRLFSIACFNIQLAIMWSPPRILFLIQQMMILRYLFSFCSFGTSVAVPVPLIKIALCRPQSPRYQPFLPRAGRGYS